MSTHDLATRLADVLCRGFDIGYWHDDAAEFTREQEYVIADTLRPVLDRVRDERIAESHRMCAALLRAAGGEVSINRYDIMSLSAESEIEMEVKGDTVVIRLKGPHEFPSPA